MTVWPRCGASAIILRAREVLLVRRGHGPLQGLWSPPGGHIEPGEPAQAAALRELEEETGVAAELAGLLDFHEVVRRDDDGLLTAHYVLLNFTGRWLAREPVAGGDAADARFVPVAEIGALPLTDGAAGFINRALARVEQRG
jgi:ADP-ribose pyrophosphatase YjhB (NUDIX family)